MSTSVPGNDSSGGEHGSPAGHPTSPGPNSTDLGQDQHADADRGADAAPRTPRNPGPDPDDLDE